MSKRIRFLKQCLSVLISLSMSFGPCAPGTVSAFAASETLPAQEADAVYATSSDAISEDEVLAEATDASPSNAEEKLYDEDGFLMDGPVAAETAETAEASETAKTSEAAVISGVQETAIPQVEKEIGEKFEESLIVDDVIITVSAPEGVFPAGAELSVRKIEDESELQDVENAVREKRPEKVSVIQSWPFDIKVLLEGEEVEPDTDRGMVRVSFALPGVDFTGKGAAVYHIQDGMEAESLETELEELAEGAADVVTDESWSLNDSVLMNQKLLFAEEAGADTGGTPAGCVVSVETDSFSIYNMELFQYEGYEYTMEEGETKLLSEIIAGLGLSGTVTGVSVSDAAMFTITETGDGDWMVARPKDNSYASKWIDVTIDGIVHRITVKTKMAFVYWGINEDGEMRISRRMLPEEYTSRDGYHGKDIYVFSGNEYMTVGIAGSHAAEVKSVIVGEENDPVHTDNLVGWFYGFTNVETIDLRYLDTSRVTFMAYTFRDCESLVTLDLSSFDTSKVQSMKGMFQNCPSLKTIIVGENWTTAALQFPSTDMFTGDVSLKGGAGTAYTSDHTDEAYAHIDAGSGYPGYFTSADAALTAVNGVSLDSRTLAMKVGEEHRLTAAVTPEIALNKNVSWTTSNETVARVDENGKVTAAGSGKAVITVTTEDGGFTAACTVTVTQPVSGITLDRSRVILEEGESLKLTATILPSDATNQNITWYSDDYGVAEVYTDGTLHTYCAGTTTVKAVTKEGNFSASCVVTVTEAQVTPYVFWFLYSDGTLELSKKKISNNKPLDGRKALQYASDLPWYSGKQNVKSVKIRGENGVIRPASVKYWFDGMRNAVSMDLSFLDTSNITDMSEMFRNCDSLASLDLSHFNTGIVTDMSNMFNGCQKMEHVDVSGFDTSKVTNMQGMFEYCHALKELNVSNFDTSNVTNMHYLFSCCWVLPELDLTNFDTFGVEDMARMFEDCYALKTIRVGRGWSTEKVTDDNGMFHLCRELKGGAGTVFSESYEDMSRAHVDGGTNDPGYLIAKVPVTGIALNQAEAVLKEGESVVLHGTVNPEDATFPGIRWVSSNETVVTVDAGGTVYANTAGSAVVTAATKDGGFTAECAVTVEEKEKPYYTVTTSDGIETLTYEYKEGETVTVGADPRIGKRFKEWEGTEGLEFQEGTDKYTNRMKFRMPASNVTLTAIYETIPITGFMVIPSAVSIEEGQKFMLAAVIEPEGADPRVEWVSSDPEIASVTETGLVTAKQAGKVVITAKSMSGTNQASCILQIIPQKVPVENVTISTDKEEMTAGDTLKLSHTLHPANADNQKVTWSSSDGNIAEVDSEGNVTAKTAGTAVITVTTEDGGYTASCEVTVKRREIRVSGVSLDQTSHEITEGESFRLSAQIAPENADNQKVTWNSSDANVAAVDSEGNVTAKAAGTAAITVTTEDGGYTASCEVAVRKPVISVTGVTLDKSKVTMKIGDSVRLNADVEPANATNRNIIWSHDHGTGVMVDIYGNVTAVGTGENIITVTTEDGRYTASCVVTVIIPVTGIQMNVSAMEMLAGDAGIPLSAAIYPGDATNRKINWTSSDPEVVRVEMDEAAMTGGNYGEVLLYAVGTGSAVITAEAVDGGYKASCRITVRVDEPPVEAFVKRLYRTCLDREADEAGLAYWCSMINTRKKEGIRLASDFVFSKEFTSKNYCNEHFVRQIYPALMGREPDESGLNYWIGRLESGTKREQLLNEFTASNEYTGLCREAGIEPGAKITVPKYGVQPYGPCAVCGEETKVVQFVKRMYKECMEREADEGGLKYWSQGLYEHTKTGKNLVVSFVLSSEMKKKQLSNDEYIRAIYRVMLGRESDSEGLAYWNGRMKAGRTLQDIINGFIDSNEFIRICNSYGIQRK